jgi:hypothetical protein
MYHLFQSPSKHGHKLHNNEVVIHGYNINSKLSANFAINSADNIHTYIEVPPSNFICNKFPISGDNFQHFRYAGRTINLRTTVDNANGTKKTRNENRCQNTD